MMIANLDILNRAAQGAALQLYKRGMECVPADEHRW
jgi:hypothetical protein